MNPQIAAVRLIDFSRRRGGFRGLLANSRAISTDNQPLLMNAVLTVAPLFIRMINILEIMRISVYLLAVAIYLLRCLSIMLHVLDIEETFP